jgi:hypothetical protein
MSMVTIEIPERFTRSFGETDEEVRRNARLELAIEMYREGKWPSASGLDPEDPTVACCRLA